MSKLIIIIIITMMMIIITVIINFKETIKETIGMCMMYMTIPQSPFLYSKLYNIYSIFDIYCIGIGDKCIV